MLLHKTPNRAKFCGDRLKNAGDIRDRKFVLPEKVGQSSPKFLGGCYPPILPNFIEIGQTSLEKLVLPDIFFCHGQKRDYFSHVLQRREARLKKLHHIMFCNFATSLLCELAICDLLSSFSTLTLWSCKLLIILLQRLAKSVRNTWNKVPWYQTRSWKIW